MVTPFAWVFNLDAEDEMAHPRGYAPGPKMLERIAAMAKRVQGLVVEGDVVLPCAREMPGHVGQAWCPTPRALRLLAGAGVAIGPAPAFELLRHVNHRSFGADRDGGLPGSGFVASVAELNDVLAAGHGGGWLLKRPFGFAGRSRRQMLRPHLDDDLMRWVEASFRDHGCLAVEPRVRRLADFCSHGYVFQDGTVRFGEPVGQECDAHGSWLRTYPIAAADLDPLERDRYLEAVEQVAAALAAERYFGPFGVDAFRWQDDRGETWFHARSDVNARYSMGWAVGMKGWRPDRASLLEGARS